METGGRKGGKNLPPVSLYLVFAILSKPNFSKPSPVRCKINGNFSLLKMTHGLLETARIQIWGKI